MDNAPTTKSIDRASNTRRTFLVLSAFCLAGFAESIAAVETAPEELIQRVASEVLDAIRALPGTGGRNIAAVAEIVNAKVMPYVDDARLTSSAVGRYWRQASPDQQGRLRDELRQLIVRVYASALAQVSNQTVQVLPRRGSQDATRAIVRTRAQGSGEPIRIDYRLIRGAQGWKVYDMSVLGVWLAQNYRSSFAREISAHGIEGLIQRLTEKNKSNNAR